MDERQKARAAAWCRQGPARGEWKLARLDVICAMDPREWPVGRIELHHRTRGHIVEIATGAGGTDAIFNALAQHFGIDASLAGLSVRFEPECDARLAHFAVITDLLVGTTMYRGVAHSGDLLLSTAAAYLDALSMAQIDRAIAKDRATGLRSACVWPRDFEVEGDRRAS